MLSFFLSPFPRLATFLDKFASFCQGPMNSHSKEMRKGSALMKCGTSYCCGSDCMRGWPDRRICFTWFQVIKPFLLWNNWKSQRGQDILSSGADGERTIEHWRVQCRVAIGTVEIWRDGSNSTGHKCSDAHVEGQLGFLRFQDWMFQCRTTNQKGQVVEYWWISLDFCRRAATCAFPCPKKWPQRELSSLIARPHSAPSILIHVVWPITWLRRILSGCQSLLSPGSIPAIGGSCSLRYEDHCKRWPAKSIKNCRFVPVSAILHIGFASKFGGLKNRQPDPAKSQYDGKVGLSLSLFWDMPHFRGLPSIFFSKMITLVHSERDGTGHARLLQVCVNSAGCWRLKS